MCPSFDISFLPLTLSLDRVDDIVSARSGEFKLNLTPLRKSIHALQTASLSLDFEKFTAERRLQKVLGKLKKRGSKLRKLRRKARKAFCRIQKKLGHPCKKHEHPPLDTPTLPTSRINGKDVKPRIGRLPAFLHEEKERQEQEVLFGVSKHAGFDLKPLHGCPHNRGPPYAHLDASFPHPKLPLPPLKELKEFREAVKRVREVNQKLIAFERGLISEDGIPQREWYKHLGVAPGRWLGKFCSKFPYHNALC